MFEKLLNHHWLVAISLFVFMALAVELGYRIGIKSRIEDDQDRKEQLKSIGDGLSVLLSLLLSFTLTMAVARYDHRRELVVREADAIGTTYLRAATLGQPYQRKVEQLLRNYVDARIDFFAAGFDPAQLEQAVRNSSRLQQELWENMVAVSQSDRTPVVVAFMNSLNEVIDLDSQRLAALQNRIPPRVWLLIIIVALIAVFTQGLPLKRRFWLTLVLGPMTIAIAVGLIADLDSSRSGFIRVDQGPMYRLKADIHPK
jgi:RsiW-degrading membrane proteinase PrsW (M82 family)